MVFSYGSLAHGAVCGATGVLAIAQPALFAAIFSLFCSLAGVAVPAFTSAGGAPLAFAGLFMVGWGVKDIHVAVTSPKASSGLLCAESSVAITALAAGYALSEPAFYVFAAIPALFTAWSLAEFSSAKPAKQAKA
jgi:hypothetical protein